MHVIRSTVAFVAIALNAGLVSGQEQEDATTTDLARQTRQEPPTGPSELGDLSQDADQADAVDEIELERISVDKAPESEDDLDDAELDDDISLDSLTPEITTREAELAELRRNFDLYRDALTAGSYGEADVLAKRMVELSIKINGLDSHESARALTNLGLVQHKNKEFESAILNFNSAIDIIERLDDRLSDQLINPLRGLGAAQRGAGRPDRAEKTYARAVHITHVNEGPHNLDQIDVLEELAETKLAMDKQKEALAIHESIYNLEVRHANLNDEDLLPALKRQAKWLNRMRQFEKERQTWRKIIDIIEERSGKEDLALIEPLTGLGNSYLFVSDLALEYYSDASMAAGDTYLKRALKIAMKNPDTTWEIQQRALLTVADYYTMSLRPSKARRVYEETWALLSSDEARLTERANSLEKPTLLQDIYPPKYYHSTKTDNGGEPPENFEIGEIVAQFDLTDQGFAKDVKIVEATPPGLTDMEYAVQREIRNLIHRPRLVDGQLADTPDMLYRHEFYYRTSDLPVNEDESEAVDAVATEGS